MQKTFGDLGEGKGPWSPPVSENVNSASLNSELPDIK